MHDGMQYDPIQVQGQGHEPLKDWNSAIFKGYLLPIYNGAGKWPRILKLGGNTQSLSGPEFWIFVLLLVSRDCEVGSNWVSRSRPAVPYGANLF